MNEFQGRAPRAPRERVPRGRGRGGTQGNFRRPGSQAPGAERGRGYQANDNENGNMNETAQPRDRGNKIRLMGYKRLEDLEQNESSQDIIITLGNNRSGLEQLLRADRGELRDGMVQMLLKVFGKMLEADGPAESLSHVLRLIVKYDFLTRINKFLFGLLTEQSVPRRKKAPIHLTNALKVAKALLEVMPSESEKMVSMMMCIVKTVMEGLGGILEVKPVYDDVNEILGGVGEEIKKKREKHKRRKAGLAGVEELSQLEPPDDFRQIPVFPQLQDIQFDSQPFIRPNLISGAYRGIDHYLDVQYRLLREDFIRPLRDGINEIREFGDSDAKHRFENVKVYHDVRILFPKADDKGVLHRIQFSTENFGNIRWQNTKRLLFGNLLCFSSDMFQREVLFAVVADRKPEDLEVGNLTVAFVYDDEGDENLVSDDESDEDAEGAEAIHRGRRPVAARSLIDMRKVYTMVETDAYFEAYRHVLAGLRDTVSLPLERYIVGCETDMHAPAYLRPGTRGRVEYDFSSITGQKTKVDVLGYQWPSSDELRLNQSQAEGLKLALTHELAILQGPPGTGKTHVGLEIMKILLKNKAVWSQPRADAPNAPSSCPILVVCYTNHALDQFLEGIAKFSSKESVIVRVGGRCKNEVTKQFSLHEIRQKQRKDPDRKRGSKASRKAIWDLRGEMKNQQLAMSRNVGQLEASLRIIQKLENLKIPIRFRQQFQDVCGEIGLDEELLSWLGLKAKTREVVYREEIRNLRSDTLMFLQMLGYSDDHIGRAFYEIGEDNLHALSAHIVTHQEEWMKHSNETKEEELVDEEEDMTEEADMVQQHRMLDSDEFRRIGPMKNNEDAMKPWMEKMAAMTFDDIRHNDVLQEDRDGWQQTSKDKKKAKQMLRKQLSKTSIMTDEEERDVYNIYDLPIEDRWRLYRTWVNRWREQFLKISDSQIIEYNRSATKLAQLRRLEDAEILQGADVVAVTTTGAAKYRDLIYKLKTKIVVVEEAAEVLEAHIVTAMPKSTEHLILIGDHQQLKPSPTVYALAKQFNMDTSLFERLMKVQIPHVTLNIQHRMRPEIADLIRPRIYKDLQDHESVLYRYEITGVSKPVFFISHDVHEHNLRDGRTKQNMHEVDFLIALCDYLLKQGYEPEQITILVMYTGQLFAFRNAMPQKLRRGVRVTAVDNFQGEENDIILLSLVRSNDKASIGFLATENRICVALSRAKLALYCIGNMDLLSTKSSMWRQIFGHLENADSVGESLTLQCKNHPDRLTPVKTALDFKNVPEGGCGQQCQMRLECGHVCRRLCHPDDHSKNRCTKPCEKLLECGHRCSRPCYAACTACVKMVTKLLRCGHEQKVRCSESSVDVSCQAKVEEHLPCGHSIKVECAKSGKVDQTNCTEKCNSFLECDHACKGNCVKCYQGRLHMPCAQRCGRTLICGHKCTSNCSSCPPCEGKCQTQCVHSKCANKCGQPCTPCKEKCSWQCKHKECTMLCSEPCNREPCNEPCEKNLKCGHPCIGLCGEPCPSLCRICDEEKVTEIFFGDEEEPDARFVQLMDCKHIFTYENLDQWMNQKEDGNAIKMKECPRCKTTVWKSTRYGNIINRLLDSVNKVKKKQWGDAMLANESRGQLRDEFRKDQIMKKYHALEHKGILERLEARPSPGKLVAIEKAFRRLQSLYNLEQARDKLKAGDETIPMKYLSAFDNDIKMMTKWVMLERSQTSEQEDENFQNEISRLKHVLEYIKLFARWTQQSEPDLEVTGHIQILRQKLLETFSPYNAAIKATVAKSFKRIYEKAPGLMSTLGISEAEKKMICNAMGFAAKGHWFECPKGHVYAIGDCGGATTTAKCPECGSRIGGEAHQLDPTNRVSEIMDGARRSAYDEDMDRNHIPQDMLRDLHREGFF